MPIIAKTKDVVPTWQSREDFPHLLNERKLLGVGLEVGCQRGVFGSHVRRNWNGLMQIEVDPWRVYATDVTEAMHQEYARDAMTHMHATGRPFQIWCMPANNAARWMAHGGPQLDWVYLDGDHSYEAVKEEIELYWPLLKPGGIMAFHDWVVDGWHRHADPYNAEPAELPGQTGPGPFYVRKAVREFFAEDQISVTSEGTDMGWQSALVVKA